MTTLSIAVRCNIAIRLESVRWELMTCRQVFVCCSATTLSISVHYDIAIKLKSVRCMLTIIRLLPIFRARL